MEIELSLILFFIGFYVLIRGANVLVDGAVSVARIFNISNWFIGAVLVGIGTSIPELSINLSSIFTGNTIGLNAIVGSNTFNILFILGMLALFNPILMKREWVLKDFILNILAVIIAIFVIIFPLFGDRDFIGITRPEAFLLFIFFVGWVWYMFDGKNSDEKVSDYKIFSIFTSSVMILAGIVGVFIGGRWVINGAETIAEIFNASYSLIGLTIVAIGTSLPELTVSVVALFKRRTGIAVGNIIGSNIFDFLGIIGITALFRPIAVLPSIRFDVFATLGATLVLFVFTFIGRKYILSRMEGFVFVLLYIGYIVFIILRG